jgi:ferredoxin-NADP reductase
MAAKEMPLGGYQSRLKGREQVAEGTMAFHFEKPAGFEFRAGQAMDVTLLDPLESDSEGNTRTFSIASAPFESELMAATRMRDTAFKRSLSKVPLGTPVKVDGATGSLTLHKNSAKPAVFLAGGIGITPFHSIVRQADRERLPHQLYLFYSNRRPEDAAFLDTLRQSEKTNPNFRLIATMTEMSRSQRDWNGETGFISREMLSRHLDKLQGASTTSPALRRWWQLCARCWSGPPWTKMTSGRKSSPDIDHPRSQGGSRVWSLGPHYNSEDNGRQSHLLGC